MRLENVRSAYEDLAAKASDIVRQISLAGVGIIWVFKSSTSTSLSLDPKLLWAALFIFLTLLFDFLQYVLGTTIWFLYFRYREKKGTKGNDEFLAPTWLNWPTWMLFYLKSLMMLVAYGFYIIPFLVTKVGS